LSTSMMPKASLNCWMAEWEKESKMLAFLGILGLLEQRTRRSEIWFLGHFGHRLNLFILRSNYKLFLLKGILLLNLGCRVDNTINKVV
jgi:hypothetical protein